MSSLAVDRLQISFDPPLWKRQRRGRREVHLIADSGETLSGITARYRGLTVTAIDIPRDLTVQDRPEYGDPKFPLSELDREILRRWIQDKLRYRPEPSPLPK